MRSLPAETTSWKASHLQAIGCALAGFTFWVLADTAIKLAGQSNLPAYQVVGLTGGLIAVFVLLYALARRRLSALLPARPKHQLVRACLDLGNNLLVVVALRHLPLTLFYVLVFSAPMVVALLAALFLHEALNPRQILAILAGFSGVLIAVNLFGAHRQGDWIGYLACLVCVACFAANIVWSRVMVQTESLESLSFFSGLVSASAGGLLILFHAEPLTPRLLAMLLAIALCCALGNVCFFTALKHTTAANVSQYHYTQLVSGALLGYLIWHERPTPAMLAGGTIIVAAGLSIALSAAQEQSIKPSPLA